MLAATHLNAKDSILLSGHEGKARASVVRVFTLADTPHATEADTLRNRALILLSLPKVDKAALVMVHGIPLFLAEIGGSWYDVQGNAVIVTPVE